MTSSEVDLPKAFICHASEDKAQAIEIATELRRNGIDAWLDKWEIRPGDSLRQKIELGIDDADFFIAIVSKNSKDKPWVNQELDAALIKKIEGHTKIIPVVLSIAHEQIPLLLRSMLYVRIDGNSHIRELIDVCLGNSSRPPLLMPSKVTAARELGISPTAFDVAREINLRCKYGFVAETAIGVESLADAVGISNQDAVLAVTELEDERCVEYGPVMGGCGSVLPQNQLFVATDKAIHGFDAWEDVSTLVAAILNHGARQYSGDALCELTGWQPRRLNPALSILIDGDHVNASRSIGSAPYIASSILVTDRTRLFARRVA
jgi:hypothetical protein